MRRSDQQPLVAFSALGVSVLLGLASCGQSRALVARDEVASPSFTPAADASTDGGADGIDGAAVPMCPVTTCTYPRATCPSSEFPCDVDLRSDNENCGACGARCSLRAGSGTSSEWTCHDGRCVMGCYIPGAMDCDGNAGNGCETYTSADPNNCGGCGVKCPAGLICDNSACVTPCTPYSLPDLCPDDVCTDLATDDFNCGTCDTLCDPTDPSLPALPSDMYWGCAARRCGNAKCLNSRTADCNGNHDDGCEVTLGTDQNCKGCGDACAPGKQCVQSAQDGSYYCGCADGETACTKYTKTCIRLDDDPTNCGGCNRVCPGYASPHFVPSCTFGVCGGSCGAPYADCDGLGGNGCEVDTRVDNRNCGACGNACAIGQVCFDGQCLFAPCEPGSEETK